MTIFSKNIINAWGDAGQRWLESLPELVSTCEKKWHLSELKPFENLTYNYVVSAFSTQYNCPVVLKVGFSAKEATQEMCALKSYKGNGAVKLLDSDAPNGALLLECITPGKSLKTLFPDDEDDAIICAATVMKKLHAQPIKNKAVFPIIEHWVEVLDKENSAVPKSHLIKAAKLAHDLINSQDVHVLLHGDLHHDNILSSSRDEWLAIDPKGVIGEPAYEVGAFVCNPIPDLVHNPRACNIIAHRLDLFSDMLAIDKQRLKHWSYVQAVLAACWMAEDKGSWQPLIYCADLIDQVIL